VLIAHPAVQPQLQPLKSVIKDGLPAQQILEAGQKLPLGGGAMLWNAPRPIGIVSVILAQSIPAMVQLMAESGVKPGLPSQQVLIAVQKIDLIRGQKVLIPALLAGVVE